MGGKSLLYGGKEGYTFSNGMHIFITVAIFKATLTCKDTYFKLELFLRNIMYIFRDIEKFNNWSEFQFQLNLLYLCEIVLYIMHNCVC